MKITKESIWLPVTIIVAVLIFLLLVVILSGTGPGEIFNAIQVMFTGIAAYMISQLSYILR